MLRYNNCSPEGKSDYENVDDDATDLAVLLIASRFNLAPNIARLIVECAGLGAAEAR